MAFCSGLFKRAREVTIFVILWMSQGLILESSFIEVPKFDNTGHVLLGFDCGTLT